MAAAIISEGIITCTGLNCIIKYLLNEKHVLTMVNLVKYALKLIFCETSMAFKINIV